MKLSPNIYLSISWSLLTYLSHTHTHTHTAVLYIHVCWMNPRVCIYNYYTLTTNTIYTPFPNTDTIQTLITSLILPILVSILRTNRSLCIAFPSFPFLPFPHSSYWCLFTYLTIRHSLSLSLTIKHSLIQMLYRDQWSFVCM